MEKIKFGAFEEVLFVLLQFAMADLIWQDREIRFDSHVRFVARVRVVLARDALRVSSC